MELSEAKGKFNFLFANNKMVLGFSIAINNYF